MDPSPTQSFYTKQLTLPPIRTRGISSEIVKVRSFWDYSFASSRVTRPSISAVRTREALKATTFTTPTPTLCRLFQGAKHFHESIQALAVQLAKKVAVLAKGRTDN